MHCNVCTQSLAVIQCGWFAGGVNTLTGNIDRLDGCVNFSAAVTTLITQYTGGKLYEHEIEKLGLSLSLSEAFGLEFLTFIILKPSQYPIVLSFCWNVGDI